MRGPRFGSQRERRKNGESETENFENKAIGAFRLGPPGACSGSLCNLELFAHSSHVQIGARAKLIDKAGVGRDTPYFLFFRIYRKAKE